MKTRMVKIKQYGLRVYHAPIKGYYVYSADYLVATKPPIEDLAGIRILQSDGSFGMILAKECLNYNELPDNLLD